MSDRTREKLIKAGLYVVMMAVIILLAVLLIKSVSSKLLEGFAGQGDWHYEALPGDYEIWRINAEDIRLIAVEEKGKGSGQTVVGPYISAFWHDERYIVVKQYPGKKDGNYDRFYYCIDSETGEVSGPLDNMGYSAKCGEWGIQIEEWILTVPKPEGAVW
ncbi:MAG: hypothetical protein IKH56_06805 [Oscillospiraceae bacterium]|nr:hypothetical protein [Oscillospiraceae bacterium]